ncbi:ABC transporter permease [Candidatus Clostridium radicumherbarum]|uniref:ABC transporter permease n=1 Tax=Candidatus Clostridium radicumherbarum TaxID=3381662 RepID=A0ABW8TWB8_9CLOT
MINSYKQITNKYLKSNKKRTILTVVGVILSVALISSIGLFFNGLQQAGIDNAKKSTGSYHAAISKIDENIASKITNNPKVSRSGLYEVGSPIRLTDKLSTNVIIASDKALELLPLSLKSGRLPENNKEIAVERWLLRYIDKDAKLNSKIKINNKEYILSGILEDNSFTQIESTGLVITKDNNLSIKNATLLIEINSKTNIKAALKEIESLVNKNQIQENSMLLTMEGAGDNSTNNSINMTLGIIISVVVIVTIAVIYNAFQISVVERIKEFGLLRAIGATPKQIRNIVFKEAAIIAGFGIPIGLIFGVIAIYGISITFKLIGGTADNFIVPNVSLKIMLLSFAVGLLSIYFSALMPALFAGRISPLTAISSRNSIKKDKIKRRKSIIIKRLLGFEGELAIKNIKRNRKRYRITVFSIVISVVLFVTFKYFTDIALVMNDSTNESTKVNYSILLGSRAQEAKESIDSNLINNIREFNFVDKIYKRYNTIPFEAAIDKDKEVKDIKEIGTVYKDITYEGKDKFKLDANIMVYDKDALEASKKYLQSGNIDIDKINNENGVIVINKNQVFNIKTNKSYIGAVTDIKVGDEILLQNTDNLSNGKEQFGSGEVKKVKVIATLKEEPFNFSGNSSGLKIITTEEMAQKLAKPNSITLQGINIIIKDINNEAKATSEIENLIKTNSSLQLINYIDINNKSKTSILMIQILLYGFVVVVSLIGCVNIVNTLTTNIILRRREFATLKSIGLTQRGLRKMIIIEGMLYGFMGCVYGCTAGLGLSYLLFKSMHGIREFSYMPPIKAMIIAAAFAIFIGYLSVLSPLRRVNEDNLIDSIREE